jgi:predicted phage-related endonuclease
MALTEHQKKQRSNGIGSSEIAMLVIGEHGQPISPYGGPHTLWRKKMGVELPGEDFVSAVMERGTLLEPVIAKWWAEENGFTIRKARTRRHKTFPHCVDSCDYIASRIPPGGPPEKSCLEVKAITPTNWHKWGEPGTDQVPLEFALQAQWHCGHHDTKLCYVTADTGYGRQDYTIEADPELFLALAEVAERFWVDCVENKSEPPADKDNSTSRWISRRMKLTSETLLPAPDEVVEMMQRIRTLAIDKKTLEAELDTLENRLKQEIGEYAGFFVPGSKQKVTYKERKGRKFVAWEQLVVRCLDELATASAELAKANGLELAPPDTAAELAKLKEAFTRRGDSYRSIVKTALLNNELEGE